VRHLSRYLCGVFGIALETAGLASRPSVASTGPGCARTDGGCASYGRCALHHGAGRGRASTPPSLVSSGTGRA